MLGMTTGWCRLGVAGVERRTAEEWEEVEEWGWRAGCRTRSCRALRGRWRSLAFTVNGEPFLALRSDVTRLMLLKDQTECWLDNKMWGTRVESGRLRKLLKWLWLRTGW